MTHETNMSCALATILENEKTLGTKAVHDSIFSGVINKHVLAHIKPTIIYNEDGNSRIASIHWCVDQF